MGSRVSSGTAWAAASEFGVRVSSGKLFRSSAIDQFLRLRFGCGAVHFCVSGRKARAGTGKYNRLQLQMNAVWIFRLVGFGRFQGILRQTFPGHHGFQNGDVCGYIQRLVGEQASSCLSKASTTLSIMASMRPMVPSMLAPSTPAAPCGHRR